MNFLNEDSIYAVFWQVVRYHYSRNHALLEKLGIYPGQPPLLFILGKKDGQSQKELAERLHIKPATITVMLKRMEAAKLVERRPDDADQRVTRVYLSDHGKKVLQEVSESLRILEAECFANFTVEEKTLLRRLLMQMRDNLIKVCDKKLDG
jgi:DNA-binding MarR family transcriptional regulator